MRTYALLFACAVCGTAETKTLTLKQALDLALEQNPDVLVARLDQQKARDQVLIAKDAFVPKITGGSGLAWTVGYPTTVDGNPPSIFQARTDMSIFDRSQNYKISQAKEGLRGAGIDVTRRQEEAAYRVASLFLDAEQAAHSLESARKQGDSLARVKELMDARVAEGRELPLESKKAHLNVLRARDTVERLAVNLINAETALAQVLGMGPDDRVRAAQEERRDVAVPVSEDASIEEALEHSPELRRLESDMQAKTLEVKSYRAARLPKVSVIAQDNIFAKYNYSAFAPSTFHRNNPELGAAITVPILMGRAAQAYASDAEADMAKIRVEVARTRSRISADLRRAYQQVKSAEASRELARADLDVTREELNVDLAQYEEGRLPLARVEAMRATENEKFLVYYVAQQTAERARLNVLRLTGTLVAALK
ncbi:MAG TPA: TolC family protein [Bryobacteraceae bacterium]|nr:TolC family protein [Bryobacteraceae bacterium]